MKPARSILHVDLHPFFVAVERSLDPSLCGRPVVVGGDGAGLGVVAAVSEEARGAGVRVGLPLGEARLRCPEAVFRRGDLAAYGRVSEEVTAVLLAASRRVERPSADEAFVDLTPESPSQRPVRAAETVRDELQRRLGLEVSLGLAGSRLAARIASSWARPRGLLVVLPGYELSFLAAKPVSALELPPHLQASLERAGLATLGQVAACDEKTLTSAVGSAAARLRAAACGEEEAAIAPAAPPASVTEEQAIRDRGGDARALASVAEGLARRAARRLKPFRVGAGAVMVEVRRAGDCSRRMLCLQPPLEREDELAPAVTALVAPLLEPAEGVRGIQVRLSRLLPPSGQGALFRESPALRRAR